MVANSREEDDDSYIASSRPEHVAMISRIANAHGTTRIAHNYL